MKTRLIATVLIGGVLTIAVLSWLVPEPVVRRPPAEEPKVDSGHPPAVEDSGTLVTSILKRALEDESRLIDPHNDGWRTEAFTDAAHAQLKQLAATLAEVGDLNDSTVAPLLAENFAASAMPPDHLETVWSEGGLLIRRLGGGADGAADPEAAGYRGAAGLIEAFQGLRESLATYPQRKIKFKIVRIQAKPDSVATVVHFHASGHSADGSIEHNGKLKCQWQPGDKPGTPPLLQSLVLTDYEQAKWGAEDGGSPTMFADCTEAVMNASPAFSEQLRFGTNHWVQRIETIFNMFLEERYGMAIGDVNGDGLDDVFVCQPGGIPDRLLVHQPDGTVVDRSADAGVDLINHTGSALMVDLDNDGDQDLVLATYMRALLLSNDSTGRFALRNILKLEDHDLRSLSAADYDSDGDLDLFVCVGRSRKTGGVFDYVDARNGGANKLFRNDISSDAGTWKFTDVTDAVGLGEGNSRHSQAAAWEDFDDDGDQDLYIANDFGPNRLFRNDGGRFVDVADDAGVTDFASGMSVSWGDYNRDGKMDLYVSNMFSSAGNRITSQSDYLGASRADQRSIYQRFAKGNSLFQGLGGGKFQEVGQAAAVEMARWAWASLFVDLNSDGWEDLVVANGFITGEDTRDL